MRRRAPKVLRRLASAIAFLGADAIAFAAAAQLSNIARFMAIPLAVAVVILFVLRRLYRSRARLSVLDDVPALVSSIVVAGTLATSLDLLTEGSEGRETLLAAALFAAFVMPTRAVAYAAIRRARRRGRATADTIVVGDARVAEQVASTLLARCEYGLRPVGYVAASAEHAHSGGSVPWLGTVDRLTEVATARHVGAIVIAMDATPERDLANAVLQCRGLSCEVFVLPRLYELGAVDPDVELVWGLPLVRVTARLQRGHRTATLLPKRGLISTER